jgi:serine/threonine-protein kinase
MSAFQPGDLVGGRYRLSRIIGAGAMGTVWSARNESTDRDFALKLMLPDAVKNPMALQRFFQEAKASGRLRHRCIVEVYDLGRIEQQPGKPPDPHVGTPYLVMELLEGEPLDSVIRRRKTLPIGTSLKLVRDLARALDVAHKQRIVHRDLKPANIYLHKSLEGTLVPKILDFGVSKLVGPTNFDPIATSAGTVLGSPAYMSPEQASGETDVDGRSDVWSLGVILYKCLVGTVPFQAPNYNALMVTIARTAHPPLEGRVEGLPREVDLLVDKCLAKDRSERFESAKALADAIDKLMTEHPQLPVVDLAEIVITATELQPDDARTIATMAERSQGTLAATEVEQSKPSPTSSVPSRVPTVQVATDAMPAFRPSLSKRVRLTASVAGAALLLAIVVFVARRPSEPASQPATASSPVFQPPPAPTPSAPPPPPAAPPPESATTTPPVVSANPTATATATAVVHKAATKPVVKATTKPTAKPAHEGVTGAGF